METTIAQLLQSLSEATREKEKAFENCQHDRDYFCCREIEAEQLAINAVNEHLNELIEAKVNQMLKRV